MHDGIQTTFRELIDAGHLQVGDGYRTKQAEHGLPGLPILRVAEVIDGRIDPKFEDFVSDDYRPAMGQKISRPGDIVLTTKGTVGRVAMMPTGSPEFVYSPQVCFFRAPPTSSVVSQYLYYWFKSEQFWSQARSLKGQTDMADYINLADIRSLRILTPPKSVQDSIVAVLGAVDDKIAVNGRIACTSLGLAQAQYDEAAKSESWRSLPMGQSARWLSGGTPSTTEPSYWDGDIPWISALSLKSPWIADSDRKVTQLGVEHGTRVVPRNTILFVVRGSSLDSEFRIGLTQRDVAFGQDCKALLAADGIDPVVLFLAIRSRSAAILNLVDHAGHGAGRLATDLMSNVLVRLPDLSLQTVTCNRLTHLVDLGARCRSENRTLIELRDTLLPKLMSGEIRVRDAERIVGDAT